MFARLSAIPAPWAFLTLLQAAACLLAGPVVRGVGVIVRLTLLSWTCIVEIVG